MKKIITALGNEKINLELKKLNNIKVLFNDIQYKEGIIEILEIYSDIDFLILSDILAGELEIDELVNKIKIINNKIKIFLLTNEKRVENNNKLKKIDYVFYKNIEIQKIVELIFKEENYINTKEIIKRNNFIEKHNSKNNKINYFIEKEKTIKNIKINNKKYILKEEKNKNIEKNNKIKIKNQNINDRIINKNNNREKNNYFKTRKKDYKTEKIKYKKTIQKLKQIINYIKTLVFKNKKIFNSNKFLFKIIRKNNKKIITQKHFNSNKKYKDSKIICIAGSNGVGKSIISVNLSKLYSLLKKKVLLIDYDFQNSSISTILGIKKEKYNKDIIKVNKNMEVFIVNKEYEENETKLKNEKINNAFLEKIGEFKNKYEYIFIDTHSNNITFNLINILEMSNLIIFISDTNLLEINKSIKLLDKYISKYKINKNKFTVLFNKYNINSIDFDLLKNIFSEINILGVLKYSNIYNKLINKNKKFGFLCRKIKKEYLSICKRIERIIK